MNRTELKKISHKFNSLSNRLLQSDLNDYHDVLKKYIKYIDNTEIIINFINSCGEYELDEEDFKSVASSHGRYFFYLGDTEEEEVIRVYSILKYIGEKCKDMPYGITNAYSLSSRKEGLKKFNDRVTLVLIRHIEEYLTEVGIEMGLDENVTLNINAEKGQVNIAKDQATINAVQNNGIDTNELSKLISNMRDALEDSLTDEDKQDANDSIDIIEEELNSTQPNEKNVKTHFKILSKIGAGIKFTNACCSLITFADKVYPFLDKFKDFFK